MTRIIYGLTGALLLSACGGPGNIEGTVAGIKLEVQDAFFGFIDSPDGESKAAVIYLTDHPNFCDALKANRMPKALSSLGLDLYHNGEDGQGFVPGVGDFTVVATERDMFEPGLRAAGGFSRTDSNCEETLARSAAMAISGLIKVEKLDEKKTMSGTLDLTFGSGDKVTGNFNASYCDLDKLPSQPNCE